jgi:transposase
MHIVIIERCTACFQIPLKVTKYFFWTESYLEDQFCFYCFENTGHYSTNLSVYLSEHDLDNVEESHLAINRSSGVVRGKTDKLDSSMIARYAWT